MAVMSDGDRIGGRLPRGPHTLTREQVAADQRRRLVESMILEIAERGYAASTVAVVIERAKVSRKAFYVHFASREELLLAAFDQASTWMLDQARKAGRRSGGRTRRLEAVMRKLTRCGMESPGAIRLCAIEIAAAPEPGCARRQALMDSTGSLIESCLSSDEQPARLPPGLAAIVGGAVYRSVEARLRNSDKDELTTTTALDLARWVRSYHPAPLTFFRNPDNRPYGLWPSENGYYGGRAPGTLMLAPLDYKPPVGRQSRGQVAHLHRELILDAVARLVSEHGYSDLSAQSIAAEADLPERAFLSQFTSKEDAFATACELGHAKAQAIVARAREQAPTWRTGVRTAVAGLLDFLASEPLYTHMAFVEAPLAGNRMATRHNDQAGAYARLLFDGAPQRRRPPALAGEAVVHGLFELAFVHAVGGRVAQLPSVVQQATYLALAPYVGAPEAAEHSG